MSFFKRILGRDDKHQPTPNVEAQERIENPFSPGDLSVEYRKQNSSSQWVRFVRAKEGLSVKFRGNWYTRDTLIRAKVLKRYVDEYHDNAYLVKDCYGVMWYYVYHDYSFEDQVEITWDFVESEADGDACYNENGYGMHYMGRSTRFHSSEDPELRLFEDVLKPGDADAEIQEMLHIWKETPHESLGGSIQFLEKLINWVLPGSQTFYRDTTLIADTENIFHVGNIIRAGYFIDISSMLRKPATGVKTRFMVISAHAADLGQITGLSANTHMFVLHPNSYLQVLDVYKVEDVTQICLLHIPYMGIPHFAKVGGVNFIQGVLQISLIDIARKSLDTKMQQEVHEASLNEDWVKRTYQLIGCNDEGQQLSLEYVQDFGTGQIKHLSDAIHRLANDYDELNRPAN